MDTPNAAYVPFGIMSPNPAGRVRDGVVEVSEAPNQRRLGELVNEGEQVIGRSEAPGLTPVGVVSSSARSLSTMSA